MSEQDKSKENPVEVTVKVICGVGHNNGTRTGVGTTREAALEKIVFGQLTNEQCNIPGCRNPILHISGT